ncbi:MAG: aminotransferase class V-fold PLP-dependent enzyme [Bryobacteraceae bacterium]
MQNPGGASNLTHGPNRRHLLQAATAAAALFGISRSASAAEDASLKDAAALAPPLPPDSLFDRDPEAYWTRIRNDQFLLPEWRSFLNNGSLGIISRPVLNRITEYLVTAAALNRPEGYPRWGYETLDAEREEMAQYLGCKKDELAFVHNATEALSTFANGIDLKAGDEVVMTDQEHTSGKSGWRMREARYGISVREVKLPLPPKDPAQLADLMVSAIGPRTKVLFFSGMTSPTGLILPIRQICDAARAKGVITVVDGAHMHGQIAVKISDLGCDFFAGSPHKWMFAPAGSGILYAREDMQDRCWPLVVTGGWDDKKLKANRYMRLGTNNRATIEGMLAGLRFGRAIGHDRIYTRIHALAKTVRERAARLPYIDLLTPDNNTMYGSLVGIRFKKDPKLVYEETARKKIWISAGDRVRISTHVHTRPRDVHEFFDIVEARMGKA